MNYSRQMFQRNGQVMGHGQPRTMLDLADQAGAGGSGGFDESAMTGGAPKPPMAPGVQPVMPQAGQPQQTMSKLQRLLAARKGQQPGQPGSGPANILSALRSSSGAMGNSFGGRPAEPGFKQRIKDEWLKRHPDAPVDKGFGPPPVDDGLNMPRALGDGEMPPPDQQISFPGMPGSWNDGIAGGTGQDRLSLPDSPFAEQPSNGAPQSGQGNDAFSRWGTGNIPGAENLQWGDTSKLRGFEHGKWDGSDPTYEKDTIKNTFGKIASRYDSSPDGLREMVASDPDFKKFFPEAFIVEHPTDPKLDLGNGDQIDVLFQTNQGWQWNPASESGGGMSAISGSPFGAGFSGMPEEDPEMQNKLLAALLGQGGGERSIDPAAILRALMEGGQPSL